MVGNSEVCIFYVHGPHGLELPEQWLHNNLYGIQIFFSEQLNEYLQSTYCQANNTVVENGVGTPNLRATSFVPTPEILVSPSHLPAVEDAYQVRRTLIQSTPRSV